MSFRVALKRTLVTSLAAAVVACNGAESPVGPVDRPDANLIGTVTGTVSGLVGGVGSLVSALLLPCTTQPYTKVTQTVGPTGGTIQFGKHKLVIPQGALSKVVTITAEAMPEPGNAVRFSPEGLKFGVPAQLHLSYANCKDDPLRPKLVVYTDDLLRILERLVSKDDAVAKVVRADLHHFSRYAIAW